MKIIIQFEGNFEIERRVQHLKKGQVIDVPEDEASQLINDLIAEPYVEKKKKSEVKDDGTNN